MRASIKMILPLMPLFLSLSSVSCQKYDIARPISKSAATTENADSSVSNDKADEADSLATDSPVAELPAASVTAPCTFTKSEGTLVY